MAAGCRSAASAISYSWLAVCWSCRSHGGGSSSLAVRLESRKIRFPPDYQSVRLYVICQFSEDGEFMSAEDFSDAGYACRKAGAAEIRGSAPGRSRELTVLRIYYDLPAVKVLAGIRRCGKSFLLRQIRDELRISSPAARFFDLARPAEQEAFECWFHAAMQDPALSGMGGGGKGGTAAGSGVRGHVILDHLSDPAMLDGSCRELARRGFSVFAACQEPLTSDPAGGDRNVAGCLHDLLGNSSPEAYPGTGADRRNICPSGQIVAFLLRPLSFAGARELAALSGRELCLEDYLIWGGLPEMILRGHPGNGEESAGNRCFIWHTEELMLQDALRKWPIASPKAFAEAAGFIGSASGSFASQDRIRDHLRRHRLKWPRRDPGLWLGALQSVYAGECARLIACPETADSCLRSAPVSVPAFGSAAAAERIADPAAAPASVMVREPAASCISAQSPAPGSSPESGISDHQWPCGSGGNSRDPGFCFFAMDPALCSQYRGDGAWDLNRCARTVLYNELRSRGYEVSCQELGQGRMVFHAAAAGRRRFAAVLWGRGGIRGLRNLLASVRRRREMEPIILADQRLAGGGELPAGTVSLENFLLGRVEI